MMNAAKTIFRLFLGRRLPHTRGDLRIPGLAGEVQVRRDAHGVPYILAENEPDAWFGLGFCHGQDRAFQLELILRLNRGTLAEVFGEQALPVDRLSRRIGFARAGQAHLSVMPESQKRILAAYVSGLNAGRDLGCPRPAHEFSFLRFRPTAWTAADVMGYMNYTGILLSGWTAKLTRFYVLKHDGPEALRALDSDYPDWLPVTDPVGSPAGQALDRLLEDIAALADYLGAGASNNWALAGVRTESGQPILANDPHLAPRLPAPWYLAHLRCPELSLCGASFAGMPLVPSGWNGTAAWGVTAGLVDGIDLFLEDFDPQDRTVRTGDRREPCRSLQEIYRVRGRREPFVEEILLTPRGPIVSDVMEGLGEAISMKAVWMNPRPVDGITDFHKATDFQTCRERFEHLYLASLNVGYADTSGTIGWQLIGEAPRRKKGWGTLPMPGWDPEFDWGTDHIPLEEMPWAMNPDCGYLATANNQPRQEGGGPYLGRDFVAYRQTRILELLSERSDWDLDSVRRMQLDQFSLPWREMREHVLGAPVARPQAVQAQAMLKEWDGVLAADSAPGAVYEYFIISLAQRLAREMTPNASERVLGEGFSAMFRVSSFFMLHVSLISGLLRDRPEGWFAESWDAVIEAALVEAFQRLLETLGPRPEAWTWGAVHGLVLSHQLGGRKPLAGIYNRGPYPTGGDHDTINAAGKRVGQYGAPVTGLANMRMGVEVGDWERNFFVLAGGQSGNPLSPHYDDQLAYWLRGEAISLAWSEAAIEARTIASLTLLPER